MSILRRIKPGHYESEHWEVLHDTDEPDNVDGRGFATHPITGHKYVPTLHWAWFVWNKDTGDFHDAYETLREARAFVDAAEGAS